MKCLVLIGIFALIGVCCSQEKPDFSYKPPPPQPPPQQPTPQNWKSADGNIEYGADAVNNDGIRAYIRGRQELFNNGRTKIEAYGGADRIFGGPHNRESSYGGGGRITHEWGGK